MGILSLLFLSACVFETETLPKPPDSISIKPDLSIGNQWMYRYRRYTEYWDGSKGDSTGYFIHYEISGDTMIAGIRYRTLVEEDLALLNSDIGLARYRSFYVVRADSAGVRVKALKGGERSSGRFPFKISAGASIDGGSEGFDTAHYQDEIVAMVSPVHVGQRWIYREPGSPFGLLYATKTFLGADTLLLSEQKVPVLKFQVAEENGEDARIYEWYAGDLKIFSRASSSTTYAGMDTSRVEEEFLGNRPFTREDTLAVLDGASYLDTHLYFNAPP